MRVGKRLGLPPMRVLPACPLDNGPVILAPVSAVRDNGGFNLGDPDGNLIGKPAVVVHRLLGARWTENTRGLAG